MSATSATPVPESEALAELRRRVEELAARVAGLGQLVKSGTNGAKRGWRAQVGAFCDDPVYLEIVRLGREWRDTEAPGRRQSNKG